MAFPTHIVAAAGYVFDQDGRVLLIKTLHRGYDATGGQIEEGEDLITGVLREIEEESGIKAKVKCLCGVYSNVGKYKYYDGVTTVPTKVIFDFICEYESGECRTSEESSEVLWVPKEKVLDYISTPVLRYRFEKMLSFDGTVTYASFMTKPEFQLLTERRI
ncbi:MAG: NUDIX hydrolase [Clostridia bacterium]|nr:NUDIX hydrolase [Clostridia bacterium]